MLSFNEAYLNMQANVQDYDSAALTYLKRNYNIGLHILEAELGSFYTEETIDIATEEEVSVYDLPVDYVGFKHAFVTVDTTQRNLTPVYNEDQWQYMKASNVGSYADETSHIFVRRNTFEIWPGAANDDNTITIRYESGGKDLQYDDVTAGTILTLANGSAAVTGVGTAWTTAMQGRHFKIDDDGDWYPVTTVSAVTTLVLDRNYQGLAIAAGTSTYVIGEMPKTPGPTHHIPGLFAEWQYYKGFKQNAEKAQELKNDYFQGLNIAKETYGKRYSSSYIPGRNRGGSRFNPNFPPRNMT